MSDGNCTKCSGELEYITEGCCSCHINPPCSYCTDAPLVCVDCGEIDEKLELPKINTTHKPSTPIKYKTMQESFDELPSDKFGFTKGVNTGWGMIVKGYNPDRLTKEEVLSKCGVCKYGSPHFKKFNEIFIFTYSYG